MGRSSEGGGDETSPERVAAGAERVTVGYVVRPKGVKGEVKVKPLTHSVERFDELSVVVVERQGEPDRVLRIERWRPDQPGILVKFAGIDTPEAAKECLVKGYLTICRDEVAPLPSSDAFYVFDLVGCRVEDESGRDMGAVVDVLEMPSTDVFIIRRNGEEVMVPMMSSFISDLSVADRRLVLRGVEELFQ
jgi:16S rRNA processing protein RimM